MRDENESFEATLAASFRSAQERLEWEHCLAAVFTVYGHDNKRYDVEVRRAK